MFTILISVCVKENTQSTKIIFTAKYIPWKILDILKTFLLKYLEMNN